MKITYYLNQERKKNLYCRISDGMERATFSLEHIIDPENWDSKRSEVKFDDFYYFALCEFKQYMETRFYELKSEKRSEVLSILKNEAQTFLDGSGIEGIARNMFDYFHKETGLPKYDEFVKAFQKFSGLKREEFRVQTVDSQVHFHTADKEYVVDTYEGMTHELKKMIENRSYDDLLLGTSPDIWNEIYLDPGIEKSRFMPVMLNEWKIYWSEKYKEIEQRVGSTNHLNVCKEESWRALQVFMSCYDNTADIIKLACDIDEQELFPIAVITMLSKYDPDTCYSEYCEFEFFGSGAWESVTLEKDDAEDLHFFVQPYEF